MKALKVTFADGLSQTCRLLFETSVHIGYFIHLGVFVFLQKYPKISNFGYSVPKITKNAQP